MTIRQPTDTHPEVEKLHLTLLRKTSVAKRISLMRSLTRTVVGLSRQGLKRAHPDFSTQELAELFVQLNYNLKWFDGRVKPCFGDQTVLSTEILDALLLVIEALNKLKIDYRLGGSVASSAFGVPRSTLGVDIVVDLQTKHIELLVNLLKEKYYIDGEMIRKALKSHLSFNLIHFDTMYKIDVYILKKRTYDRQDFRRKKLEFVDDKGEFGRFNFCSPEDIILNKLEWFKMGGEVSDRQWQDILGVIKAG